MFSDMDYISSELARVWVAAQTLPDAALFFICGGPRNAAVFKQIVKWHSIQDSEVEVVKGYFAIPAIATNHHLWFKKPFDKESKKTPDEYTERCQTDQMSYQE